MFHTATLDIKRKLSRSISCQFPRYTVKSIKYLPSLPPAQNCKWAAVWSFSPTQRRVMNIKPSTTEGHPMSPVVKRELVTTSERHSERKKGPRWLVFFSARHVSLALFHTVDPQPSLSPHSTPSVCIFTKTAIVPLAIAHWPALSALRCWSSRRDTQTTQRGAAQGCEGDGWVQGMVKPER